MEMKIIQDTKNEVLSRREIIAEITADMVPSRDEVRAKLATLAETNEKSLIIEKIDSGFGNPLIKIKANAYADEESMNKIEKEYFIKRNFPVEEKKEESEEAPATPVEGEAKVEESTEAPKEEANVEPAKEEAPAKVEAPKEEKKEAAEPVKEEKVEAPVAEEKTEAPKEDAPVEEKKEEKKGDQ